VPILERPGARIHWEERGKGPLVVLATQFFGYPEIWAGLVSDLDRDHRVVTYDLRGTGRSSPEGPYGMATDVGDLCALIAHTGGGPALVVGMGDGCNRGVKAAAEHPDLVRGVLTPGGNPAGRQAARGTDALVDSPAVIEALLGMIETDYRSALRVMVSGANPQMTEAEARERVDGVVAYCPQEVGTARLRAWIDDEALAAAQALGDRLWILSLSRESNPWFTPPAIDRTRELLPDAHIQGIEEGALSRPDITAGIVRQITSRHAGEATSARSA
jgi:pimeloyl-ACP methyl ester carboxylesterase